MCIGGRASLLRAFTQSPVEALGVRNGQLPWRWSLLTTPTSGSSLELFQKSNRPSNESRIPFIITYYKSRLKKHKK